MSSRFPSIDRTLIVEYLMRSYPITFSNLNLLALEVVNTIMISRMGMCYAASALFVNALFSIFKKINSGISVSVSLLVARADRTKRYDRVTKILKHALLLNVCFAVIFCIILIGLSFYIESASRSPTISALGRPYLVIISISLVPAAVNNMIRRYLEGISYGNVGLLLGFFTLFTNIFLNFLLIYGKWGGPVLGLNGAGIALVLSETMTAVVGMLYLEYVLRPNGYLLKWNFRKISWLYCKKILCVGWPVGLQFGVEGVYLLWVTIMVGWGSIEAQAAHAVLFNISQLVTIFAVGLGLAGSMLVTQQNSMHNGCLVRKVALTGCLMIGIGSILVGIIILTTSYWIIPFYKPIYAVKELVSGLIKHLCLFQLFYSFCYWGNGVLRGLNDRALPFLCSVITQSLGVIVCYLLVVKYDWGIRGVWVMLIFERMLLSIFLLIRFEYKTKAKVSI